MSNGKDMIICLIGFIKKTFSNKYIKDESAGLSIYVTKADLKNATGDDTSKLAAISDLASLNSEIDKIFQKIKNFSCWFKQIKQCR